MRSVLFDDDVDHHKAIGTDENLMGFLRFERQLEELEATLKRLLEQHQKEAQSNPETALARVRELADLADRVERAKRQRTTG